MKLDIQGQTVEVDDSFADLSPEEQQKTVGDIHQQLGTYAQAKQQQEAPADLSAVDKFRQDNPWADYPVGLLGTAGGIIAEHPVETAGALAVAKGLGIANSYVKGKNIEARAAADVARVQADTAAAHQELQRLKESNRMLRSAPVAPVAPGPQILGANGQPMSTAGPVAPTPTQPVPMGQQMNRPMPTGMGAPQPATMAAPTAAPSMLQRGMDISSQIRQLAASKVLPAVNMASKALLPAQMAMGVGYTAPDEIAVLKAAEAKKRAASWRPLNER